jgi:hypothetical protein
MVCFPNIRGTRFHFENASLIELGSGLHGGMNRTVAPADSTAAQTTARLWQARSFHTTSSPGQRVGASTRVTESAYRSPVVSPRYVATVVGPSACIAVPIAVILHCACGTAQSSRRPVDLEPVVRAMSVRIYSCPRT